MLITFRSLLFNVVAWTVSIFLTLSMLPSVLLPKTIVFTPGLWGRMISFFLKIIVNIDYRVEGRENLPKGSVIIASKHQSAWETAAFNHIFPKTSFVLKKELMYFFPLNFYMHHTQMIPLDRRGGNQALKDMIAQAKAVMSMGRTLVIFPEGTRTIVGEKVPYKRGVYILYKHLDKPVVPVALNSGLHWKRRGFRKYPGTIVVKILPAIEPGLPEEVFMSRLETSIETASVALAKE